MDISTLLIAALGVGLVIAIVSNEQALGSSLALIGAFCLVAAFLGANQASIVFQQVYAGIFGVAGSVFVTGGSILAAIGRIRVQQKKLLTAVERLSVPPASNPPQPSVSYAEPRSDRRHGIQSATIEPRAGQ